MSANTVDTLFLKVKECKEATDARSGVGLVMQKNNSYNVSSDAMLFRNGRGPFRLHLRWPPSTTENEKWKATTGKVWTRDLEPMEALSYSGKLLHKLATGGQDDRSFNDT